MPGNENNNPFNNFNNFDNNDLPKMNNENQNIQNSTPVSSPKAAIPQIEIPQAYYDKLAKEEQEKRLEEQREAERKVEVAEAANFTNVLFLFAALNAILIYVCINLSFNKKAYFFLGIPIFIAILSIVNAIKNKEKSQYPVSVMIGGMIVAIVTFIISMMQQDEGDLWMHYALFSAAVGFIGMIVSNVITKIINDFKNIKAVQALGYILFFALLIGVPTYLSINYREEFYRLIFNQQVDVVAETEEEFILKTMKARYNVEFSHCGRYATKQDAAAKKITEGQYESYINELNQRETIRVCSDPQGNHTTIKSTAYNEGSVQYIVSDDYLDVLFLYGTKSALEKDIKGTTGTSEVELSLYPKENCYFYGDCAECDEYYARYKIENDTNNKYKTSTTINFEKYLTNNSKDFINNNEFKYIFSITGQFSNSSDYATMVDNLLKRLNNLGYKNTYGYIISIYNSNSDTADLVYKVKGDTNDEKTFKNPEVLNVSANR